MSDRRIAVVWDSACAHSNWHREMVDGLRKAAASHADVVLYDKPTAEEMEAMPDPVILFGFSQEHLVSAVEGLTRRNKRVILVGMDAASLSSENISCVTLSRSGQTIRIVKYLQHCGRDRIAMVGVGRRSINDYVKVDTALNYSGGVIRSEDVFDWSDTAAEAIDAFLEKAGNYNGIICPNDYFAMLLLRALHQKGYSVPRDFFLVSFSDCVISRCSIPGITSMTTDCEIQGRYAYSLWQQLCASEDIGVTFRISVPGKLMIRESTDNMPEEEWEGFPTFKVQNEQDRFYSDPPLQELMLIENCLAKRDALDLRILEDLLAGDSYETIAGRCYLSMNAVHYRVSKMYRDAGVSGRKQFQDFFQRVYGPFRLPNA